MEFAQQTIPVNGIDMNVVIAGEGPDVLLVHGFPDDHMIWQHTIPALVEAGYRVIAPDTRGCGKSSLLPNVADYGIEHLTADLDALLDHLGVKTVKLVAHDWGAVICWQYACTRPERVERYAALSVGHPLAYASGPLEQKLKGWYVLFFQLRTLPEWFVSAGNWWFLRRFMNFAEGATHAIANYRDRRRLTAGINYYRANFRMLTRGKHARCKVPVMGIYSTGDRYLAAAQMEESAKFVDAPFRYEVVEGAHHWLQMDAPDKVNALILDYLKEELA